MLNKEKEKRIVKLESRLINNSTALEGMPHEQRQGRIRELVLKWLAHMPDAEFKELAGEIDSIRTLGEKEFTRIHTMTEPEIDKELALTETELDYSTDDEEADPLENRRKAVQRYICDMHDETFKDFANEVYYIREKEKKKFYEFKDKE